MNKLKPQKTLIVENIMWSIALPGFAQVLNKKFIKGFLLIFLEIVVNVQSKLNMAILYSFQANISEAIQITNYQWLMFYPCLYLFAIYDAYKDLWGEDRPPRFSFLPFIFSAYFGTIGVIYSTEILGPVFLPILSLIGGAMVGYVIQHLLKKFVV